MTMTTEGAAAVATLRTTTAIRERAQHLLQRARVGNSAWFLVDDDALDRAAAEVADVTRSRYPTLAIPYHGRWRHFEAGGVDRRSELDSRTADSDVAPRARSMIDLAVVSVLLDAGAGPDWHYTEPGTGLRLTRSEGLGVASWHAFGSGLFSSDPADPLRADAGALRGLDDESLAAAFQVDPGNPLLGLTGRVQLLRRLGTQLAARPDVFGPDGRPGGLFDMVTGPTVTAHDLLSAVLDALSGVWLTDNTIGGQPLGDCWRHQAAPGPGLSRGWMPFHKLSQWLTYSLLEPFERAGVAVTELDALTGLPEYRNGGLLLDTGVLRLRDAALAEKDWTVDDELIVEWRALTVALLDELAPLIRDRLGAPRLPLACVLEGGTWATGRALAARLRDGAPPLSIISDGTVF
ncbi:uracil phosphoribosyltransferase [Mycolicibacterium peregrinum]|uniref:URC4/urg3 family protein n=1 Tax=Mycolicibacterium peregrinum TaxID=43304 RepID=UPI0006D76A0F|nr:URC4/urg3 family protein [Mycolicibacterium peregrinum]MCV7206897.1 URC4/urg3 family protein [Mycolicibacterium peregrinum]ORW62766.1 uracil phosphoribosyltransferase [Mycolicibacterium peregrinum]OWL99078.1 uracil phosphoribosyltransferase [Mycolicibacterium peregrinum]